MFVSPEFDLALYKAIEPTLTAQAVSEAFRAGWKSGPTLVHVSTKQPIEGAEKASQYEEIITRVRAA